MMIFNMKILGILSCFKKKLAILNFLSEIGLSMLGSNFDRPNFSLEIKKARVFFEVQ